MQGNDMSNRGNLSWYKWWVQDADDCRESLTNEQMGELFFAVMAYVKNPERLNVSPEIRFPYASFCNKVDAARKAYVKTSEVRAEAGRKGGKAKAAKANGAISSGEQAGKAAPVSFKSPTKTEFKSMIRHLRNKGEITVDDYEALDFYQTLERSAWTINGIPLQSMEVLGHFVITRFYSEQSPLERILSYNASCEIYKQTDGAEYDESDFIDRCYSSSFQLFDVNGHQFNTSELEAAVKEYLANESK